VAPVPVISVHDVHGEVESTEGVEPPDGGVEPPGSEEPPGGEEPSTVDPGKGVTGQSEGSSAS